MSRKYEYVDNARLSEKDEIKAKAGCVWSQISRGYPYSEIDRLCKSYGITKEQASEWRDFWMSKIENK